MLPDDFGAESCDLDGFSCPADEELSFRRLCLGDLKPFLPFLLLLLFSFLPFALSVSLSANVGFAGSAVTCADCAGVAGTAAGCCVAG